VFGGLQLGRVRRQEEQVHVVGDAEAHARVPSCPIQHEDDLLVGAAANLAGKRPQFHLEEQDTDRGRQVEARPSRGRMHEADQIAPVVAMLDRRDGALAWGSR
jgi:hypothetical protein